jgi:uridine phosphorylase
MTEMGTGGAWNPQNFITADKKLLIAKLPMGAPFTASMAEEAIACGGRVFLILGCAGGLGKRRRIADIVLCTRAVRDEGTSHHYLKTSNYVSPSSLLTRKIEDELRRNKMKFYRGATWTIDAPYAETQKEIQHYKKKGVLTVEMEAAALFAVAKKRNASAAAAFTVSDILGEEWSGFSKGRYLGYDKLAQVAKMFKNLKV